MFYKKRSIILVSFMVAVSCAFGTPTQDQQTSLKSLISKVKNAPPSQRRVLMNQLKIKLRSMQQSSRRAVMLELRKAFAAQNGNHDKGGRMQSGAMHGSMQPMMNGMTAQQIKQMQESMQCDSMKRSGNPGSMPMGPWNQP